MFPLVGWILLFLAVGAGFILVNLLVGKLVRPERPHAEKATIYECGEPTIGSAWVQFDLRFYVVALLFVIFDVEVAFFFPWAVLFGQANAVAQQKEPPASPEERRAYNERVRKIVPWYAMNRSERARFTDDANEKPLSEADVARTGEAGQSLGWMALWDILVFFGVLLVGFAYLWRRGDLAWVRSVSSEAAAPPPLAPPVRAEGERLMTTAH